MVMLTMAKSGPGWDVVDGFFCLPRPQRGQPDVSGPLGGQPDVSGPLGGAFLIPRPLAEEPHWLTDLDGMPLRNLSMLWHIITGEYPPDPGGVSDYSAVLAQSLAASGHEVQVWCAGDDDGVVVEMGGVEVHRVAGRFGPLGLARLGRALDRYSGARRILIQYVPSAFGWKAMNLLFVAWVLARRFWWQDDIRVMFHEVAFPWVRTPLRHNILAVVNRIMAAALVRACTRAYVSIPGWLPSLRQLGARRVPIAWTPIPATVPNVPTAGRCM